MASEVLVDALPGEGRILLQGMPLRMTTVVQGIIGARHVRDTDDWTVPLSWSSVHQVANDLGRSVDLKYSDRFTAWTGGEYDRVQRLFGLQTSSDWQGNARLFPLQRVGTEFLLTGKRVILGDDMGAGKTVMTCDALESVDCKAILIACPRTLFGTWENHVHEWTSDIIPIVAADSSDKRKKAIARACDLVNKGRRVALIMNYESVWRHTRLSPYGNLRMERCQKCLPQAADPVTEAKCETHEKELNAVDWDVVICDEAHRVINVSKQTRGIWHLSKNAEYVWALTGTPTRGSVSDFWSLLRLVDPAAWPSRVKFIDRYCMSTTDSFGNLVVYGVNPRRKEEFEQVTGQYMLRRMFEQIMKGRAEALGEEYTPTSIVKEERRVELTREQRALYNEIVDNIVITLPNGNVIFADNALTELTRLLQVSSTMIETDDDGKVHMILPSPKIKELLQLADDLGDASFLVYATHRDLAKLAAEALEKHGVPTSQVHGDIDPDRRDVEIQRFQDGDTRALCATFAAGGEGLTLTKAHYTIYLQRSWSMILNKQADGRTHRFGQKSNRVIYVDIIAEDTVESRVHDAYADKLDALEAVVNDAARLKALL